MTPGTFQTAGNITFAVARRPRSAWLPTETRPCCRGCAPRNRQNPGEGGDRKSPLDKLTMVDQRLSERIDRRSGYPTEQFEISAGFLLRPFAHPRLGFDGDGNPTMMKRRRAWSRHRSIDGIHDCALPAGAAGSLPESDRRHPRRLDGYRITVVSD